MRVALVALLLPVAAHAAPLRAKAILYHYNLQYVAGGMNRFPDGISRDPNFNLSEERVEDLIITESFAPLLDVLERHPTWHIDLELQGMMIEAMAARHQATLDKLRALAKAGTVEVVSFHYSDQLFLAYPKRDLVRSVALNKKVFETHDIPLSKVVFTQEGQFNEGMLRVMAEHGYSIGVMASNLWTYQHGADPQSKFMQRHGVDVVVSGGATFSDLTVEWEGPGDGELIVTGETNPYLGLQGFKVVPAEVMKWESERAAEEQAGMKHLTVTELVAEAKARGTFPQMPPLTDGSWRPRDTRNLFRWMGGLGGVWDLISNVTTERDDTVLRTNAQASLDVAACEAVVRWAADRTGHEARAAALDEAARELMYAQVSDSTGWNPWLGEVSYSLDHAQKAKDAAKRCIDSPALRGSNVRRIDLKTGEVTGIKALTETAPPEVVDALLTVTADAPGREVRMQWSRLAPDRIELVVEATAGSSKNDHRLLSLTFPMGFDRIVYAPALDEENVVDLPASDFGPNVEHSIPAPSGLVGLGPDRFLVKDVRVSHLALLVKPALRQLEVRDETLHHDQPARWRFELVDADAARANEVAHALNVTPVVEYPLEPRGGCGCGSSGGGLGLLALLLLLACTSKPKAPCEVQAPSKRPWAMRMAETSGTVAWESRAKGCVELGLTPEGSMTETVVEGAAREVQVDVGYDLGGVKPADETGTFVMNEVPLSGLTAGTCYTYRLAGADAAGGRFCTAKAPGQDVRFVAIGDTAVRWGHTETLLPKALEPAPDFVVHLGDIQYYASLTETWAGWFPKAAPMLKAGAFLPCIGNHEEEITGELDAYYLRLFASPGTSGTPRWYRYASGGVHFFSLDTQSPLGAGSEQLQWVTQELAAAKATAGFRFSVVYFHKPAYTLSNHAPLLDVRAALEPLLAPNGVKLVLQGHNHVYERFDVNGVTWVVSGGGGAPLYSTEDNVGAHPNDVPLRVAKASDYNAVQVSVTAGKLTAVAVNEAGAELDRFELSVP